MTGWADVVAAVPELAGRAEALFAVRRHATLATLRADGAPRISGIETTFAGGELRLGMMPGSVKVRDLLRNPRLALHSPTVDPPQDEPTAWPGEAKVAGRAVEWSGPAAGAADDPAEPTAPSTWFRVDVSEVVVTTVGDPPDHLVVQSWHPGVGYRRRERR